MHTLVDPFFKRAVISQRLLGLTPDLTVDGACCVQMWIYCARYMCVQLCILCLLRYVNICKLFCVLLCIATNCTIFFFYSSALHCRAHSCFQYIVRWFDVCFWYVAIFLKSKMVLKAYSAVNVERNIV